MKVKWVYLKRELSVTVKCWLIYILALTHGHKIFVVTERMRFWIQRMEKRFLGRVAGFSLRDSKRSSVIQEGNRVEPLPLSHQGVLSISTVVLPRWSISVISYKEEHDGEIIYYIYIYISAGLSDPGRAGGGVSLLLQTHISGRRWMDNLYVFFWCTAKGFPPPTITGN